MNTWQWHHAKDRYPTTDDADKYGYVLVWIDDPGFALITHYTLVTKKSLWARIPNPNEFASK